MPSTSSRGSRRPPSGPATSLPFPRWAGRHVSPRVESGFQPARDLDRDSGPSR
jgi:hypothetical protein